MVSVEETARALEGVLRIARFNRAGVTSFGRDLNACARSFWAYGLALPAALLLLVFNAYVAQTETPVLLGASEIVGQIIEAVGFPLLLLPLLARFGRAERWPWFVAGYNWFVMAQTIATATLVCLAVGLPGGGLLLGGARIYFIVLEAFLADAVLEIGAWRAAMVVLLDIGFSFGVDRIADWVGGVS
jgi:hypothetical protein